MDIEMQDKEKNKQETVLTGITTTGTPHLGNYVGAIRPAIAASQQEQDVNAYYFLADFHALIKCQDPEKVHESTREIAATVTQQCLGQGFRQPQLADPSRATDQESMWQTILAMLIQ